jgi:hypothetical protein
MYSMIAVRVIEEAWRDPDTCITHKFRFYLKRGNFTMGLAAQQPMGAFNIQLVDDVDTTSESLDDQRESGRSCDSSSLAVYHTEDTSDSSRASFGFGEQRNMRVR